MRRVLLALAVFLVALALRVDVRREVPPFDDLYHLKRIHYSAAHLPRVLAFDRDRGVTGLFCPWPPLYDLGCALFVRATGATSDAAIDARLRWLPPIGYALFAALVSWLVARSCVAAPRPLLAAATAGFVLALAPWLIAISRSASIDHHWAESMLVLPIVYATRQRRGVLLGVAIVAALFVQTALLAAVALAFAAIFLFDAEPRFAAVGFGLAAATVLLWRIAQPAGYPDNPWFLGWPHAAALVAACVACALSKRRVVALAAGVACLLPFLPAIVRGVHFFGGDPWLSRIVEFQPMFHHLDRLGTDVANIGGAAVLAFVVARRERAVALFAIAYLALAISSSRFLVPAIPLFALAAALAVARARTSRGALAACALALAAPLAYDAYAVTQPWPRDDAPRALAMRVRPLAPGRVLAPWWAGHAIDVIGRHPVVIDNFGSMPDAQLFDEAQRALAARDFAWCRAHGVRWLIDDRLRIWPVE